MTSTKISKNMRDGWMAETIVSLPEIKSNEGPAELRVSTSKRSSGLLATFATVQYRKPDGCITFMMFQDFSKCIRNERVARVTEKTVAEAHKLALAEALPAALSEIFTHYGVTERAPHIMNDAVDFHEMGHGWSESLAMPNID